MTTIARLLLCTPGLTLLSSCASTTLVPGSPVCATATSELQPQGTAQVAAFAPTLAWVPPPTWQPASPAAAASAQQNPPVIVEDTRVDGVQDNFVLGVMFGQRSLDSDEYAPVDDPWSFGVDLAVKPGDIPIAVEFGTILAGRRNSGVELAQGELYLGGRLYVLPGYRVRPFVSGGGTLMTAEISQGGFGTDETSTGLYLRAGAMLAVTDFFSIGADYRWVLGTQYDMEFAGLGGPDSDLDYGQWSAGLVFHF
jgi:opacity protein-like surface antigen